MLVKNDKIVTSALEKKVRDLELALAECRKTEEALKEREAHSRAMIDAFHGFIYTCSRDYRIGFMNDRLKERTGYDATGHFCYRALHGLDSVCPWCVNEQVFSGGKVVQWDVRSPRDGRWYHVSNTPVYKAGGVIAKQAMILDISDQKRAEEALRESEDRYRSLVQQASDGIFIADVDGNYLDVNESGCRMVGYSREQILTMNIRDLVPPENTAEIPERLAELRCGKTILSTRSLLRRDGSTVPVEINASMLSDGRLLGFVRDITERKRAEAARLQADAKYRILFEQAGD